jgi:hypothetical protein
MTGAGGRSPPIMFTVAKPDGLTITISRRFSSAMLGQPGVG